MVSRWVYLQKNFIVDARLGSKYASAFTWIEDSSNIFFYKVFYNKTFEVCDFFKYFISFNSSSMLWNI